MAFLPLNLTSQIIKNRANLSGIVLFKGYKPLNLTSKTTKFKVALPYLNSSLKRYRRFL
jgi:hypothetical protein